MAAYRFSFPDGDGSEKPESDFVERGCSVGAPRFRLFCGGCVDVVILSFSYIQIGPSATLEVQRPKN